jgi:hypothetical protein
LERARKRGGRVVHRFGGGSARQAAEAVVNSVFLPTDSAEDPFILSLLITVSG